MIGQGILENIHGSIFFIQKVIIKPSLVSGCYILKNIHFYKYLFVKTNIMQHFEMLDNY